MTRMRGVILIVLAATLAGGAWHLLNNRTSGCEVNERGATLYLNRMGIETMRAQFCWASDCRLIAEQMSRVERATWYCR